MIGLKRSWRAYLFVLPALLLFFLFLLKPMVETLFLSLYHIDLVDKEFVGLGNYISLFIDPIFWTSLKNTLFFVIMVVPAKILLSLAIALMLIGRKSIIQSLFRGIFYFPAITAGVVMTCVWWWLFDPLYGPINYFLSLVGIPPIMWLGHMTWAKVAVILVLLNWTTGLGIILYLTALAGIPRQIYEAAQIDGAGRLKLFFNITVPLILPITLFLLVVTTIGIFQVWQVIFILTEGGPAYGTTSIVHRIYEVGFNRFAFGQASAYATVLLAIIFPVAYWQFRLLNREVEM